MEGACSYFVSAYSKPIETGGVTIGGGMTIGRTYEGTLKNYPHYFASSSDNNVYFVVMIFISRVIIFNPQTP